MSRRMRTRTLFRFYRNCGTMSMSVKSVRQDPGYQMLLKKQLDVLQNGNQAPASPRRLPVQDRSLRTVQRVLDAASSLLEQTSLEDVTTTRVAAEAGLSIGALYRFFPDKQSIIDAIAVRHVGQFRASLEDSVMKVLEREIANLETFDPAVVLDSVVDAYIVYLDAHPDFRTISFGRYISAATKE